jgi:hypothetical protein
MPTCSVAVIEFKKESWKDIAKGQGELLFYEYPKRLAKYYAEIRAGVESDVFDQLIRVFKKTDEKATLVNEQAIRKLAKGAAKEFTSLLRVFKKKENKKIDINKGQQATIQEKTQGTAKEQEKPG